MKQVKRLTGLLMCIVLAAGCLTGCGGKSDETILTSSVKNINSVKNFDMAMKMDGSIKMSMGGESQDIDMGLELKGTQFTDPLKAKYTTTVKTLGSTVSLESYIQKEGDNYVSYTKAEDEWSKVSIGDLDAAMAQTYSMQKQLVEDASKYVKKDDIEENGKKYLTYEYTITGDSIKSMIDSLTSTMGSTMGNLGEDESKMLDDMIKSIGDIKMTILIDRETEAIYQIRYPMGDMLKKMMDSVMKSVASLYGEEANEEMKDMKIDVTGMDAVITYSNMGSAADFEVPKEALEAKEEDLSAHSVDAE